MCPDNELQIYNPPISISNKSSLTRQVDLGDVSKVVEGVVLHGGDVVVHEEEPGEPGARVCQPGGGHGLQVVVGQREHREAEDQSQGVIRLTDQSEQSSPGQAGQRGGAEADDRVVAEVQHGQGRQAWNENLI